MPQTPHVEQHFTASEVVRDIVIGVSDGLTVPFALAAGLSGTVASTSIIITAGLAEIAAGAIAMGLGGYLAAKSDADHYVSELKREHRELREKPAAEVKEVMDIFQSYGSTTEESQAITKGLLRKANALVDFMMRFELGLEQSTPGCALTSAFTIACSYIAGGLVPLGSYFFFPNAKTALTFSVIITSIALAIFGYVKSCFTGAKPIRNAVQTVLTGGLAAAAAFFIAKFISKLKLF